MKRLRCVEFYYAGLAMRDRFEVMVRYLFCDMQIWGAWIKELFAMAMEIHQEGNSPDLLVEVCVAYCFRTAAESNRWRSLYGGRHHCHELYRGLYFNRFSPHFQTCRQTICLRT